MSEVATFVMPVSQFEFNESAYECVIYCIVQCRFMAPPGQTPTATPEQIDQLADAWYAKLEGSYAASNTNGMSLEAAYAALDGLGISYIKMPEINSTSAHASDIANVKAMLAKGYPVIICGAESGFYDVGLGDIVPYTWPPSGNHCIIASGVAPSGNLLVHDMANVGHGLIPGATREYDITRMYLVSGTAVIPQWIGEDVSVQITDPVIQQYFNIVNGNCLQRKDTGVMMGSGITAFYLKYGGTGILRLPETNEIAVNAQKYPGVVYVVMEGEIIVWDPNRLLDNPPSTEGAYLMHIGSGLGQQLIAGALAQKEQALQSALQTIVTTAQQALRV
ncbi:MAG: hypothetical protein B7X06_02915 [Verrucomicrobia bacterium 21-51-4]|nr:MAG: hypothetical protein B7X06_02915 [Verrucomicrobia bacterium 21-51-4]